MPTVLITPEALRDQDGPHIDILKEGGFDISFPADTTLARGHHNDDEVVKQLAGVSAAIASGETYNHNILSRLPEYKVIARCGVGFDKVNVAEATSLNVPLTITPNSNHEAVAELSLMLLLAAAKNLREMDNICRAGRWDRVLPRPIRGLTAGIVGLGRIGRSTALRYKAMGMKLMAYDQYPHMEFIEEHGVELVKLDQLLAQADVVSVHCPLNDETRNMFNADLFGQMKNDAIFINTARGGLVVEEDLYDALRNGKLHSAGLDVFQQEPPQADNPVFTLDNAVFSPHVAGTDQKSLSDMACEAATYIVALSRNEWPSGSVINQELAANWDWETSRQ
jgi:phosphoglycerate dehydrogenase-like enzyme